jgi:hypothetical protein
MTPDEVEDVLKKGASSGKTPEDFFKWAAENTGLVWQEVEVMMSNSMNIGGEELRAKIIKKYGANVEQ